MKERIQNIAQWAQQKSRTKVAAFGLLLAGFFLGSLLPAAADIVNSATATGTYLGNTVTSTPSNVSVPVAPATAIIGLVKTGSFNDVNNNGVADLSDTITYSFTVSNLGQVTLSNIAVTDPMLASITCAATSLAPSATMTCTVPPYALKQADLNAGQVSNQATVTASTATGTTVIDKSDPSVAGPSANAPTIVKLNPAASVGLVKTATGYNDLNSNGQPDAGETITYAMHVTNTGGVTLANLGVTDPKVSGITCLTTTLAPGQSTDCKGNDYQITQADIDAGSVLNQATAQATTPGGSVVKDLSDPTSSAVGRDQPTTVALLQKPVVGLVKTGSVVDVNNNGIIDVGDQIKYAFAVTNLGNTTVSFVGVSDNKIGTLTCVLTTLAPKQVTSCSGANYTLTQADIDAGQVSNQAIVTAKSPNGTIVSDPSDPTTPGPGNDQPTVTSLAPTPAIGLVKAIGTITDVNNNGLVDAGDTITYTFAVTNMGNLTLHGVAVTDAKVPSVSCPAAPLAPGLSENCSAPAYVITQADVDAGKVTNSATATGLDPAGATVSDVSDNTTPGAGHSNPTVTSLAPSPAVGLVKTAGGIVDANGDGVVDAGDTIAYSFTVSNMGNVSLSNVAVTDPKIAGITCPATTLAPAASTICSAAPYKLTQADVDAGSVTNQAQVAATSPTGTSVTDKSDPTKPGVGNDNPTVVTIPQKAVIGLIKTAGAIFDANADGKVDAGDTITYSLSVSNLGTVTLAGVAISDPMLTAITCPKAILAPAEMMACTVPAYTITAANMSAGSVSNQATATGQPPFGLAVSDPSDPKVAGPSANAPTVVMLTPVPVIGLVKTAAAPVDANGDGVLDAGDTIAYSFTVSNLGNVPLKSVAVTDPKVNNIVCPAGALNPGQQIACTSPVYVITQTDMDAGQASNSATATGVPPSGPTVSDVSDPQTAGPSANNPTIVLLPSKPALSVVKVDKVNGPIVVGSTISYTFTVKNTGPVTINGILLADAGSTVSGGPIASLVPGASDTTTFTAVHVLTSSDITAGFYTNTGTVSGTPVTPGSQPVSASGSVTTPLNLSSSMSFTKSAVLANGNVVPPKAGDKVNYSFVVTNTGSSPLFNVAISDPLVAQNADTQQRMVALLDTAKAGADDAFATADIGGITIHGGIVEAAQRHAHALLGLAPADGNALMVERQILRMSGAAGALQSGEKIGFVYSVTNVGTDPVSSILISQPDAVAFGSDISLLKAGDTNAASVIFTREITPQEALSGQVVANAYVTFHIGDAEGLVQVQDALPLSSIQTYDDVATASISPASDPQLDPGKSFTFTAPYTLTQADIDAGTRHNMATATAKDAGGNGQIKTASFDLPLTQKPAVGVVKKGTLTFKNGVSAQVGDVIKYNFAVTNLGNVTLKALNITDAPLTVIGAAIPSLAPGVTDSTTFTAQYPLTQADIDAGKYQNQATVTATAGGVSIPPVLSDFADPAQHRPTVTPIAPTAAIGLLKQVIKIVDTNNSGRNDAGDVIQYQFTVYNFGNVTLSNISIVDKIGGGVAVLISGNPIASLAPGATSTAITGSYAITQADMDVGHVDNTATATGSAPDGTKVSHDSDPLVPTQGNPTIQPLGQQPQIVLFKKYASYDDVNKDGIIDAGDVLHYTFEVQNTGNVTLTNLQLTDAGSTVLGNGQSVTLAPGTFNGSIFTATHVVTTSEEQAGVVHNTATVTANEIIPSATVSAVSQNGDHTNSNPGTTDTPIQPTPAIAILLLAPSYADTNNDGIVDAGDTLTYKVTVKNTGAVPLNAITVKDAATGLNVSGTLNSTLQPSSSDFNSFTASYVLTAADIAAGFFNGQLKATGNDASAPSTVVTDLSDPTDVTKNNPTPYVIGANPQITALKAFDHFENASGVTIPAPSTGSVAVYKISVQNTGNIAFDAVTLAENTGFVDTITPAGPFALAKNATDTSHIAKHTVTNAEMLAGKLVDQIKATGTNTSKGLSASALSDGKVLGAASPQPTIVDLVATPGLAVVKTYTVQDNNNNGIADAGDTIIYKFQVVNTGNIDLSNVTISDANAVLGATTVIAALPVGATNTTTFTGTHLVTVGDVALGKYANQAKITATEIPGGVLSDKNSISANPPTPTVTPLFTTAPVLTKVAGRSQVKRGEVVPYTITASNITGASYQLADIMPPGFGFVAGSAIANGTAVTPLVNGSILTFNNLAPASGKITLTLNLMASATIGGGGGKFVNNARLIDPSTNAVLAVAQASVQITPDAVFDCSDIIGRVFDDKNGDGYMQDGELGLPGVRIATVNGQLVTTDAEGRFHVPCAAIPDSAIGGNFIMKLDPRTLPQGYKITTENPRVVRVTRGKMTELNFGATLIHQVKVDLSGKAFDPDTADLTMKWSVGVDRLIAILRKRHSELTLVYHQGGETGELAQARMEAVDAMVRQAWASGGGAYELVVKSNVEEGK